MSNPATISWLKYGWESSFGSEATTIDKTFGHGVRITGLNRKNNMEPIYSLGSRNAQKIVPKKFEGSLTVEFVLANPWFFKAVLGSVSTSGSGPYTHTFSEANTLPSMTVENDVSTDTPSVAKMLGVLVATCTLTASVGEVVRVRLDLVYGNETHSTTTSSQVSESFELFTFAHGTLELPDGTTIAEVQNVEITINNNPELLYGLGSRKAQKGPVKQREYTARVTLAFEDSATLLQKFYGGSGGVQNNVLETATMELVFDNGETGTAHRQIKLSFTGIQVDEHNLPQDPTSLIVEDATLHMRSCTVTAINNTSTVP